jgi:hypothetical protein
MKYIITESKLKYLRRLNILDRLINISMEMFERWHFSYVDVDYMINHISADVTESYFFRYQEDDYVDGFDFDELEGLLKSYLNLEWRDRIEKQIKKRKG